MRREVCALTAVLVLMAQTARTAPISIEIHGERVNIRAEKVPLVQILNGVAWESKMKIVYDTAPPQVLVSVDIKGATLSDAITELLQGHGLLYMAKMDPSGTRVETLLLTNGGAGTVRLDAPPPPPEPEYQPEYQPEYVPEVPPEIPIEHVPTPEPTPYQPPASPSAGWTPAPVVLPGMVGGMAGANPPMYQPGQPVPGHPVPGYQPGVPGYSTNMPGMHGGGAPAAHSSHGPPQNPEYVPTPEPPAPEE
jgi:hypothetical protein